MQERLAILDYRGSVLSPGQYNDSQVIHCCKGKYDHVDIGCTSGGRAHASNLENQITSK